MRLASVDERPLPVARRLRALVALDGVEQRGVEGRLTGERTERIGDRVGERRVAVVGRDVDRRQFGQRLSKFGSGGSSAIAR